MRLIGIVIAGILASTGLAQQPSAQTMKTFASSSDVQALIENAKKIRKEGQPLVSQPIVQLAPINANLNIVLRWERPLFMKKKLSCST